MDFERQKVREKRKHLVKPKLREIDWKKLTERLRLREKG